MLFRSDRKSTRLNSSHTIISYAVFCLKKKKEIVTCGRVRRSAPGRGLSPPCSRRACAGSPQTPSRRQPLGCALPLTAFFFFFNDTATTEIYTLSLHDALPILLGATRAWIWTRSSVTPS